MAIPAKFGFVGEKLVLDLTFGPRNSADGLSALGGILQVARPSGRRAPELRDQQGQVDAVLPSRFNPATGRRIAQLGLRAR